MELNDIRGGRLDVISEEGEHQDFSRESSTMEACYVVPEPGGRTFQRFSVNTNESLHFEPCEGSCPSPTGAEDDVFEKGEFEGGIISVRNQLQGKVAEMENFAGHLEEIFLTVERGRGRGRSRGRGRGRGSSRSRGREGWGRQQAQSSDYERQELQEWRRADMKENFGRQEQHLEQHYNDVLQTLSQQYDERATGLQEEKKSKLESLYSQLLVCGQALDASKVLIETAKEIYRCQDKRLFLKTVMPIIKRVEEFAKEDIDLTLATSLEFSTPLADLTNVKTMMDSINIVPAPSAPVINPQLPNSATQTSLHVCWSLFSDDTVEYYELYYRPVLEDTPADSTCAPQESKVKVKETHCTVTDLLPNAQYELWVTATNTTGISPASEKALYMTVPSPPVIKHRECSSCPEAALIRWESGNTNPVDSYTVELSETGTVGTESNITESIVAVPTCQCLIQLQAGRQYFISVRAVNIGGPSDRSDAITISTTGTFFYLLEDTAHPCLSMSEDGFTIFYGDEELPITAMAFEDNTFTRCVAILGDLIPVRGRHYWEVEVDEDTEFRVGVAYEDTERDSYLGANSSSWCMRHIRTPSRHKYEFLHNGWSPDLRITVHPVRIGVALDYDRGTLSFFNAHLEQHLHTFHCHFQSYVHPCFSLDNPGALTVHNGIAAPDYTFI